MTKVFFVGQTRLPLENLDVIPVRRQAHREFAVLELEAVLAVKGAQ